MIRSPNTCSNHDGNSIWNGNNSQFDDRVCAGQGGLKLTTQLSATMGSGSLQYSVSSCRQPGEAIDPRASAASCRTIACSELSLKTCLQRGLYFVIALQGGEDIIMCCAVLCCAVLCSTSHQVWRQCVQLDSSTDRAKSHLIRLQHANACIKQFLVCSSR